MTIEEMRLNYAQGALHTKDIDQDPLVQFQKWFDQARQADPPEWLEINAMTLSTTDNRGNVSSRIVLLRGIEQGGFVFFTNYDSTKGQQINDCPRASLCFYWPHLQRQVRVEGEVSKTSRERSDQYFQTRPRDSQLGAHVSRQSAEIESRGVLETQMERLKAKYGEGRIPCPDNWGGYLLTPTRLEFWQGRPSRLHDRIVYHRNDGGWRMIRLSP
jgi:pyridoxamine 5'-phosphate oxidase